MKKIQIAYCDYQPGKHIDDGDDFAFQSCDTKGWITQSDVEGIVHAALSHVLSTLKPGDKLSVTIEVRTEEEAV